MAKASEICNTQYKPIAMHQLSHALHQDKSMFLLAMLTQEEFGAKNDIWTDTDCIFVTPYIYNDTVSVSKTSPIMTDEFKAALQDAFIAIGETPEGLEVISIYSHEGYKKATSADYDGARKAMELSRQN